MVDGFEAEQAERAARDVRSKLMAKASGDEEMFALGSSVARVVQMATSDDQGTQDLAYYVLSDPALTQRILRLSNTVCYRTASGMQVTTVTRAISLLGFDNVKTAALAMMLVDALGTSAHANSVRIELEASLCASLVGRELGRRSSHAGAEEASIAALFKNLGPLLVASHEHERYREINKLVATGKHSVAQAAQKVLGCSYDTLSEAVLGEWNMPDPIVRALQAPPAGALKPAANRGEWMRQVAALSMDVARLVGREAEPADGAGAQALLARYGKALALDKDAFDGLFATVREEMNGLLESMHLAPPRLEEPEPDGLPGVLQQAALDGGAVADEKHASGKPKNAREQLLAGLQDVIQLRAGGHARVNEVVSAVLETLYQAMGFRFATVALRDLKSGQYRARASFGAEHAALQAGFIFPAEARRDLFHLAMENDADLMIADAGTAKMRELLPSWHRALLPDAKSFIVLPLVVNKVQLGLFYADRTRTAPEGVPPDETSLIKALKSQVLAALGSG
ncbi:HDOD domain-containing protein [Massilia terrae]|uniref:HDOD domain-containing protein n=1 Tax=Massilia terrae TaxID=1811224 RepID=A0ABT2CXS7_9BURK|nr:HDOD domain-containing protein [Massilia terrae]MCS0658784.1 HDOD domain-containing protein [Massilia terrae]